jgi:hypothetical protein
MLRSPAGMAGAFYGGRVFEQILPPPLHEQAGRLQPLVPATSRFLPGAKFK